MNASTRLPIMLIAAFAALTIPATSSGQELAEIPFSMPTPEGWRTETIPFPLEFAPELEHEGLEELRFAPGMFDAAADDFWTYAFVWWVPIDTTIGVERLQSDLESYFGGLTETVAEARGFDAGRAGVSVEIEELFGDPGRTRRFTGRAATLDPFTTRKPVVLNLRVEIVNCPAVSRLAVVFELSPKPMAHKLWQELAKIRGGVSCPNGR